MNCKYCGHPGMRIINSGISYKCEWCGTSFPRKIEPLEEVSFTDINTFKDNIKKIPVVPLPPFWLRDFFNKKIVELWTGDVLK